MRIVVTGATGNVGSAVVRRLVAHGHDVVGVVRRPPDDPGALTWTRADLATDCHETLVHAFRGAQAVVHLVWGFQPTHRVDYLEEVGVGGTRRILAAVAEAGVPHLVHQSSIGAYSPRRGPEPVGEDWPTEGIPSSPYSRHKAAGERLLDAFEEQTDVVVTRTRPGIVAQHAAGSGQLRYFLPTLVPASLVRHVPVLPLYRGFTLQVVHADDLAAAIGTAVEGRIPGPFNLVTEPVLSRDDLAAAFGARMVHLPFGLLRAGADLSWRAHLQPVDAGWLDMARNVPILDAGRAAAELGWRPQRGALAVLDEMVAAMGDPGHGDTAVLRPRTVVDGLRRAVTRGPVGHRRCP